MYLNAPDIMWRRCMQCADQFRKALSELRSHRCFVLFWWLHLFNKSRYYFIAFLKKWKWGTKNHTLNSHNPILVTQNCVSQIMVIADWKDQKFSLIVNDSKRANWLKVLCKIAPFFPAKTRLICTLSAQISIKRLAEVKYINNNYMSIYAQRLLNARENH